MSNKDKLISRKFELLDLITKTLERLKHDPTHNIFNAELQTYSKQLSATQKAIKAF